jgi:hypothetical protein
VADGGRHVERATQVGTPALLRRPGLLTLPPDCQRRTLRPAWGC